MKKIFTLKILLVLALLLSVAKLNAQVHIGADVAPKPFSVLELYAKYKTDPVDTYGGLRMPQLDTVQRNALSRTYGADPAFFGLTIYNTNNNCLEYWNSTRWVSLCLGAANIILECEPCDYDPSTPIPDGEPCICTPKEVPPCPGPNPYQIYLVTGFAYATVQVMDPFTSAFTVTFEENNSIYPRVAIVRVTSNCTGEFKDFPFIQEGGTCPGGGAFSVTTNTETLCDNIGAAIAWVTNPEPGIDYIWTLNGSMVHTGNLYEIGRAGKYTIYPGLIGCEPKQEITITLIPGGPSPNCLFARSNNDGVICSNGSVTLTAHTPTYPVQWFQNDKMYTGTYSDGTAGPASANPLIVSTASAAGEWFAVQMDDPCGSRICNRITLVYMDVPSLPDPIFKINGTLYNDTPPPVICVNGTLELEIVNHAAFPPGTIYEWFSNGVSIYPPVTYPIIYTNPPGPGTVIISVTASNTSGDCPSSTQTPTITVIHPAPFMPIINNNASTAYICGSVAAGLEVTNASGVTYEWFRNSTDPCRFVTGVQYEKMPSSTSPYGATDPDCYAVRYMDGNGCWSELSPAIRVIRENLMIIDWLGVPPDSIVAGLEMPSSVSTSTQLHILTWTLSNTNALKVPGSEQIFSSRLGGSVDIKYLTPNSTVIVKAEAKNNCNAASIEKSVYIKGGCIPITGTAVSISPSGTITRQGNASCPPTQASTLFTTNTPGVTDQSGLTFDWYVNGVKQTAVSGPGAAFATFTYFTPTTPGNYLIYCIVTDNCIPPNSRTSNTTTVTVPPCFVCTQDVSGNYRISGKVCYDVNQTNGTTANGCMPTAGRVNDFAGGYSFPNSYTFSSPTGQPFYVLEWSVTGPANLASMPANTGSNLGTLTFLSGIIAQATGRDRTTALKYTITVKFCTTAGSASACATSGTGCRYVTLDVFVQDCNCGCTVNSTLTQAPYNGKITFLCYNLGVAEATKNWTIEQQVAYTSTATDHTVYGALYQWGRNTDGHQIRVPSVINWSSSITYNPVTYQPVSAAGLFIRRGTTAGGTSDNQNWLNQNITTLWNSGTETAPRKSVNDPCPVGWRVPTITEWQSILNGNSTAVTGVAATGYTSASGNVWKWTGATGTRGHLVTPSGQSQPTLFLPAAGYRQGPTDISVANSLVNTATQSRYNSSTATGTNNTLGARIDQTRLEMGESYSRTYGRSVRCVSE